MSCLFMNIPDFEYKKCVYWIDDGCQDNDPNCGNGDALCNETIERFKQLEATLKKIKEYCNERKEHGIGVAGYVKPDECLKIVLSWIERWAQKTLEDK